MTRTLACLALLVGCGQSSAPPPPPHESPRPPIEEPPVEPPHVDPSIDLLHAVRTDLAVSSNYRDQLFQAGYLVDGDLGTTWNSRTGDLTTAWIEVRLPPSATVTSIQMTGGFTKQDGATDLFSGNHRIARVHVTRDGEDLGVHSLDPSSRELQTIDVTGPGGVYRIEIVEVVAGTNHAWRELCISELRIMGTSADAHEGARFPRIAVARLPEPRVQSGTVDRAEVAQRMQSTAQWYVQQWIELSRSVGSNDCSAGPITSTDVGHYARMRRDILYRLADLVDLVDEEHADSLRANAARLGEWGDAGIDADRAATIRNLIDRGARAFENVVSWLADDESHCRWARADADVRMARISDHLQALQTNIEANVDFQQVGEVLAPADYTERPNALSAFADRWSRIHETWQRDPHAAAVQIGRVHDFPSIARLQPEWEALQRQIEVLSACH